MFLNQATLCSSTQLFCPNLTYAVFLYLISFAHVLPSHPFFSGRYILVRTNSVFQITRATFHHSLTNCCNNIWLTQRQIHLLKKIQNIGTRPTDRPSKNEFGKIQIFVLAVRWTTASQLLVTICIFQKQKQEKRRRQHFRLGPNVLFILAQPTIYCQ